MKKQPKLILRESSIQDVSGSWPAGRFVEMGAGTGHMTRFFLERGFSGACHDLGEDSRQMMRRNLADAGERMRVVDDLSELLPEEFDYLFAFEVLEHIEPDRDVLREWVRYLKPGGRVLLSVPAHSRKYGRSDELVGHVRRYEKDQLHRLMHEAGIEDIRIINYGYPITELTRRLSNRMVRNDRSYEGLSPEQRSIRSAQAKPKAVTRALSLLSDKLILPFCVVQRWFYDHDLGDGYVACGVKRAA
ncbi:MAG: methyltransferase domain-containing protein [Rhodanobacter sp.]